jgi:hypothetical protein
MIEEPNIQISHNQSTVLYTVVKHLYWHREETIRIFRMLQKIMFENKSTNIY